jgi:glycosyltransferase involved in cell wall biosynthesis
MGSLYILPLLIFRKFKFINGIIADAPSKINWYQKPYIRGQLTYPFSDVVLSNSLAGIKSYHAPLKKTFCIYNGIDMARFQNLKNSQELKKEIGIEKFSYVIGMVGAFHDRKDYITFVNAATKVIKQQNDICFLLIGEGKNQQSIEDIVPEDDRANILFLGRRADVEDLIQVFDIGVLCTNSDLHGEGVSNSIIEYMSLGKPVIATEGGGTNEVIIDSENGYLIKHNGVDELAERILYLYHHPEVSKQMGEKALETIKKKFLLGRMTDEFIAVYKGEKIKL